MEITEVVAALVGLAALAGILVRIIPRWRPRGHVGVVANGLVVIIMCLSQSWIYTPVDQFLGGRNVANLLSHLALAGVIWTSAFMLGPVLYNRRHPKYNWVTGPIVLTVIGTVVAFVALGEQSTSRGLDAYDGELAYSFYWMFTLTGMWVPARWFVPRLWHQCKIRSGRLRVSLGFLLVSYSLSIPCVCGFFLVVWAPTTMLLREALVLVTAGTLALGYVTTPLSQKRSDVDKTSYYAHERAKQDLLK